MGCDERQRGIRRARGHPPKERRGRPIIHCLLAIAGFVFAQSAYGGGGVSSCGYSHPEGWGSGISTTQSGSSASNGSRDVTVSENSTDWGYPAPFLYNQWYKGNLDFTAYTVSGYSAEPQASILVASAGVDGYAYALGNIEVNDPDYYYLRLYGEAIYNIGGTTSLTLSGNIQ